MTKAEIKTFLKTKLSTDDVWAKRALLRIYEFQTEGEKAVEETTVHNDVGFSGIDGQILSSYAVQLMNKKYLTPRQLEVLKAKMQKYWKQIYEISDKEKLESAMKASC